MTIDKGELKFCNVGAELYNTMNSILEDDDRYFTQEHMDSWRAFRKHFNSCEQCKFTEENT